MKKGCGSETTIIVGPSKSFLVYALHSLEYVLRLARFWVFVPKLYHIIYSFITTWVFELRRPQDNQANHNELPRALDQPVLNQRGKHVIMSYRCSLESPHHRGPYVDPSDQNSRDQSVEFLDVFEAKARSTEEFKYCMKFIKILCKANYRK